MLDIGWSELMVIGVLALLVVGPKELPRLLRTVGQFVGKARGIAREFQRSMEDAAREADLKELTDLKRDMDRMTRVDFNTQAKRSADSLMSGGKKTEDPAVEEEGASAEPAKPAAEPARPATEPAKPAPEAEDETPRKAASGER